MERRLLLAALGLLAAQSGESLRFEAVSVRRHEARSIIRISGNRFADTGTSLKKLIMDAYNVQAFQVSGLPAGNELYDIAATVKTGTALGQARRMLETMLAERFQLKLHREMRELPVYMLVAAGAKLTPLKSPGTCSGVGKDGRRGVETASPWDGMADLLSDLADRPVIDKTGFAGSYCAPYGQDPVAALDVAHIRSGEASIFKNVEEKWGLKLDAQKSRVEILVVDHLGRPPEN
jgi:uncharacterized protein (TIGR03435 family)